MTGVFTLGVAISVFSYNVVLSLQKANLQSEFGFVASQRFHALENNIESHLSVTSSVQNVFDLYETTTRSGFRIWTEDSLNKFAGLKALKWVPRVFWYERKTFEDDARLQGIYDYRIFENQEGERIRVDHRVEYYPTLYVEPEEPNLKSIGYDEASDPKLKFSLELARDSGLPVATQTEPLQVFAPIYADGKRSKLSGPLWRYQNLKGFVVGIFDLQSILDESLALFDKEDLNLFIYDRDSKESSLLASRVQTDESPFAFKMEIPSITQAVIAKLRWLNLQRMGGVSYQKNIEVATRVWEVSAFPTPNFLERFELWWLSWAVLSVLVAFTFLITGLLIWSLRRSSKSKTAMIAQTERLEEAKQQLNDFSYAVSHDLKEPLQAIEFLSDMVRDDTTGGFDQLGERRVDLLKGQVDQMQNMLQGFSGLRKRDPDSEELSEVNLEELITEKIDLLRPPKNVRINVLEHLPTIPCEKLKIGQVFYDLLLFSIKAAKNGGGIIDIGHSQRRRDWEFYIEVDGLRQARDLKEIQLSKVKKVLGAMGGRVWMERSPRGFSFSFSIRKRGASQLLEGEKG